MLREVLMALCSGATLHVPAPGMLAGSALRDVLQAGHITHATLPPALLAAQPYDPLPELQRSSWPAKPPRTPGAALAAGRRLINAYGPIGGLWA
jgi:hypothetical protein